MTQALFSSPVGRLLLAGKALGAWTLSSMFHRRPARTVVRNRDRSVGDEDECRRSMRSVLESHVIPRLVQAHHVGAVPATGRDTRSLEPEVAGFARCCAVGDRQAAAAVIERLREAGIGQEHIFVDLIAPAARRLGEQWEEDEVSFTDVTIGLVLMHEVIHSMGYEYLDGPQHAGGVRRVMLASAPGSQHVLGLSIVSEFFRSAGWQVVLEVSQSSQELCHAVQNEWFDLVGLSVALDAQLEELPALVARLKGASRNPGTPVLLGGPVFSVRDCAPEAFGAQAICLDARDSVVLAQSLLAA